jgi:hypothetical protein
MSSNADSSLPHVVLSGRLGGRRSLLLFRQVQQSDEHLAVDRETCSYGQEAAASWLAVPRSGAAA